MGLRSHRAHEEAVAKKWGQFRRNLAVFEVRLPQIGKKKMFLQIKQLFHLQLLITGLPWQLSYSARG